MGRVTVRFYFWRVFACDRCRAPAARLLSPSVDADEPKPVRAAGNWVTIKGQVVFPAGKEIPSGRP